MLHAGLDLSRRRLDYCLLDERGERVEVGAAPPDGDGLAGFARRVEARHGPVAVRAAIESMNGARFVHDTLERSGWEVEVADAQRVRGLAPLACKTDKIDAWVLAELSRRDLVPAISLPDFAQRRARARPLQAVPGAQALRAQAPRARPAAGLRAHLPGLGPVRPPGPGAARAARVPRALALGRARRRGPDRRPGWRDRADRPGAQAARRRPSLHPAAHERAGIAWVLGYTLAAEIGDIDRFASPKKLTGYTGLCPRVYQSGNTDRRGHLTHAGPKYLRWALMEAATHACRHAAYRERYRRNKARLGRLRGAKVAQVDIARRLAEAIWHMLTRNQPFAPAGATPALAA